MSHSNSNTLETTSKDYFGEGISTVQKQEPK